MMNKWLIRFFLLLIVGIHSVSIFAQPDADPEYGGLDIVFLVDQSGSMGGANYGYEGEGTDPLDLRFDAIDYAIDALGQYRLSLAPDVPMQISVINFGDQASRDDISRGWIAIAETGDRSQWDALYTTLSQELSADAFRERSSTDSDYLGNTNFLDAFLAASTMFGQLPDDSANPHLRVVILLTDGVPCVPADFTCGDVAGQANHMTELNTFVSAQFPDERYVSYVIALDAQNDFWPTWADEWQSITGDPSQAARAETNQQVGVRFYNIMIELVNRVRGTEIVDSQTLQPGDNTIFLPPYLSEARFSIFKSNTSPGVLQISRPDGRELALDSPELVIVNQDRPIEIWTVLDPMPGEWLITVGSTDDRIDVYLELVPVEVSANLVGGPYIQFTDVDINFELTGSDGNPLLILNDPYDLNVTMNIIQPDGTSLSRSLSREIDSQFTGSFRAEQGGLHTIVLQAETRTLDDRIYTVLESRQVATFEVLGINLDVQGLPSGDYLVGEFIDLEASLTDQNGDTLNMDNVDIVAEQLVNDRVVTYTFEYNTESGLYNLSLPSEAEGNYSLTVNAISSDATQNTILSSSGESRYVVLASQIVGIRQLSPLENPASQLSHEGYLPPRPSDLVLEVESYLLEDNSAIALETIANNPQTLWNYTVLRNGEPYSDTEISFEASTENGRYQLIVDNPPAGDYDISLTASGELQGTYLLQQDSTLTTVVTVERNWLPEIIYAVSAVLILLIVVLVIRSIQINRQLGKHPARGRIELQEEETKEMVWSYNFGKKGRNKQLLKDSKLRKHGVKSILVECPDERHSRDKKIRVSIEMADGKRIPNRVLSPGKTLRLSQGSLGRGSGEDKKRYILVKDPNASALR